MTNFYVSCRRRRQLGVGLSPAAPTKKSKSVAISDSYPNLSTFRFPTKAARAADYLPNDRRLISARPSQSSRRMGLNDATNWTGRIGSIEGSQYLPRARDPIRGGMYRILSTPVQTDWHEGGRMQTDACIRKTVRIRW